MRKSVALMALNATLAGAALAQDNGDVVMVFEGAGQTLEARPSDFAGVQTAVTEGRSVLLLDLAPEAADGLAVLTSAALGQDVTISLCGTPMLTVVAQAPIADGKVLIPMTDDGSASVAGTVLRGEVACSAIRAEQ